MYERTQYALQRLRMMDEWPPCKKQGNDLKLLIETWNFYRVTLILRNVDMPGIDPEEWLIVGDNGISVEEDEHGYTLFCELGDGEDDETIPFEMTFEKADVRIELFDGVNCATHWQNPWDGLIFISADFLKKVDLPGENYNDLEKALLPLAQELTQLGTYGNSKEYHFPFLKELVQKYGMSTIVNRLKELEESEEGHRRLHLLSGLRAMLLKKECEPVWRDIFDRFTASQTDYPSKTERIFPKEALWKIRNKIQKRMESYGYSGAYPDFYKGGSFSGIREIESYGKSYTVISEKNMRHHVHCIEATVGITYLKIKFLSGTEFLRKGEPSSDAFACQFNEKGRRLSFMMDTTLFFDDEFEPVAPPGNCLSLEQCIDIVMKKIELKKLTKEEREFLSRSSVINWNKLILIYVIAGAMFSLCLGAGFVLLSSIIFGDTSLIRVVFDIWWPKYFLLCWIAFSGLILFAKARSLK